MTSRKFPPLLPLQGTQGRRFTEEITSTGSLGTTIEVEGPLPPGLTAISIGNRVTISGTPTRPGDYKVRVVEKRSTTMTILVSSEQYLLNGPHRIG